VDQVVFNRLLLLHDLALHVAGFLLFHHALRAVPVIRLVRVQSSVRAVCPVATVLGQAVAEAGLLEQQAIAADLLIPIALLRRMSDLAWVVALEVTVAVLCVHRMHLPQKMNELGVDNGEHDCLLVVEELLEPFHE
jgi:hypothetical protein